MAKTAGNITIKLDNTDSVRHSAKQQIIAALEECGLTEERYAKGNCPVDTGNLHRFDKEAPPL